MTEGNPYGWWFVWRVREFFVRLLLLMPLYLLALSLLCALLLLLILCIQSLLFAFHFISMEMCVMAFSFHVSVSVFYNLHVLLHVRRCFNAVRSNAGNWFKFGTNELGAVCLALTQNFDAISCVYNIYKYTYTYTHYTQTSKSVLTYSCRCALFFCCCLFIFFTIHIPSQWQNAMYLFRATKFQWHQLSFRLFR